MDEASVRMEIRYVAMHLERPPKIRLYLDIALENRRAEPRWVLLPDRLPGPGGAYVVRALEVYLLGIHRRAVVGHLIGAHGCQALLLPGNARIQLRDFPILFWGYEIPDAVTIEAVSAAALRIGGEPAAAWFGPVLDDGPAGYPISESGADVDASALAEQMEVRRSRRAAGDQDLSVALTDLEGMQVRIEVPA